MVMEKRFPLKQWFDLAKKIDKYDVETCLAQMALYALKDGLDPHGVEWQESARELKATVTLHNAPFIELQQRQEDMAALSKKISILKRRNPANSASQRRFMEKATRNGVPETLAHLELCLATLKNSGTARTLRAKCGVTGSDFGYFCPKSRKGKN